MNTQSRPLDFSDRIYLQVRYGLDTETLRSIQRMGLSRTQTVHLLEERRKRGLPPTSVWTSTPNPL